MKEAVKSPESAAREAEPRRKQREAPVHRLRTISANPAVVVIQAITPAILAWKRADASAIRSIIEPVFMLISRYVVGLLTDHWAKSWDQRQSRSNQSEPTNLNVESGIRILLFSIHWPLCSTVGRNCCYDVVNSKLVPTFLAGPSPSSETRSYSR
jgi:hypothetical protein